MVSDVRIPDLLEVLTLSPGDPLPVTVVVTGGAGGIEPASRWASGSELLELRSLEIALRDLDDLAGNARRIAIAADTGLDVPVHVEPPLAPELVGGHGWSAALDVVAEHELRLKWRTGGATPDMFPSAETVATALDAALDRELPFKASAGLHHALRHRDDSTGLEHHGFLNVLLATRAAFDGAGRDEVVATARRARHRRGPGQGRRDWRRCADGRPPVVHVLRLRRGARPAGGPARPRARAPRRPAPAMTEEAREDGRRLRWATHRDARRAALVEAVAAAVEEHGPDVQLDAIAASAGVTKPVLYRYFSGKDELLAAAALWGAERIVEAITVALTDARDERTAVESAVGAYLAEVEAHRNLFLLVIRHRARSVSGSVAEGKSAAADVLARALVNGLSATEVARSGVDVWAHALVGMGLSTAEWWLVSGTTSRAEVARWLSSFVWHAFDGVRRDRTLTD